MAEPQDKADRNETESPTEEKEVEIKGNQSELEIEEIELVGDDCNQG